ncbi:ATP-binding protein [Cobetia sp. 5-11-6-3]|uniref:ATP-binding protein n=1 Tax=Cobetia sp. 5-11-6-3 TaxID=2737458 RepID=UPI001596DF72|nr:ATP-binding protein [Cobetia sp. 5-11-6-3]
MSKPRPTDGAPRPTRRWVWHELLRHALVPLLVMEVALLGGYLGLHWLVAQQQEATREDLIRTQLEQLSRYEAEHAGMVVEDWRREVQQLAHSALREMDAPIAPGERVREMARHVFSEDGTLYVAEDDGEAGSYYSSLAPSYLQDYGKVARLSRLDTVMQDMLEIRPELRQAWFSSYDGYFRIKPWIDTHGIFTPGVDLTSYGFYYLADDRNNPTREPVVTPAYQDPVGGGWLISTLMPVHRGDFLEGVVGIDVTLDALAKHLESTRLPWNAYLVLVSGNSVLAMPEAGQKDFGVHVPPRIEPTPLTHDRFLETARDQSKSPEMVRLLHGIDDAPHGMRKIPLLAGERLVAWYPVAGTDWRLLAVVDPQQVESGIQHWNTRFNQLGYVMLVGLIAFFLVLLVVMRWRAESMATTLSEALERLSDMALRIGRGQPVVRQRFALQELDQAGEALREAALRRDQIELERAEDARHVEMVMAASGDATWRYDFERDDLHFHENFFLMMGLPIQASMHLADLDAMTHPEDLAGMLESRWRVLHGDSWAEARDVRYRHADGSWVWMQVRGQVTRRDGDGRPLRATGVVLDIQRHKQTLQVLEAARDSATEASQSKSRFFSSFSHEIRTPLNAILGFTDLLADESSLTREQRRYVDEAGHAASQLSALIEDVLQMSSLEAGELPLDCQPLSIGQHLIRLVSQYQPRLDQAELTLSLALEEASLWLNADRRRLDQILGNLMGNAIKYNRAGGWIRLALGRGIDSHGQEMAWVDVEDGGFGFDPNQAAQLFQPFSRLGREDSGIEGTGLGLALSRELARRMQGEITAQSVLGEGACFRVWLPLADVSAHEQVVKAAWSADQALPVACRWLVISTRAEDRLRLEVISSHVANLDIITASSAAQALRLVRDVSPCMVIFGDVADMSVASLFSEIQRLPREAPLWAVRIGERTGAEADGLPPEFFAVGESPPGMQDVEHWIEWLNVRLREFLEAREQDEERER